MVVQSGGHSKILGGPCSPGPRVRFVHYASVLSQFLGLSYYWSVRYAHQHMLMGVLAPRSLQVRPGSEDPHRFEQKNSDLWYILEKGELIHHK